MICLGIESTAHTLGIGICKDGKILSNAHDIYKPKIEGIVPRKAADHHAEVFLQMFFQALEEAKISPEQIDLFAFAQGPGIGACLSTGITAAKSLAQKYRKPLIGVNHPYAHIKIAEKFTSLKDPLILYVSGGNTQILSEEKGQLQILGETLDIGLGNLFDSFARATKVSYAHGSTLEKIAKGGRYIELPYTVKGVNLSFTGLQTASIRALSNHALEDVTYSLMETAFSECCEAVERALFLKNKKSILICGGVAQNRRLQEMLSAIAKEDNVLFGVAPDEYNRDNGAMIAYTGEQLYLKYGTKPLDSWKIEPFQRVDSKSLFPNVK